MRGWANAAAGATMVLALWWLASLALSVRVLPAPPAVFARMAALVGEDLLLHASASLVRVLAGLALAIATAAPIGILMGRVRRADFVLQPLAYLLYPVPKVALLPVVLLVVGIGNAAKITILLLVLFFQVLVAVRDASRAVDAQYVTTMRSLGGTSLSVLRYVVWPIVLPRLITAARLGSATALAVLFFAETFFTRYGLGHFIVEQWSRVAYIDMFAGIVTLSLVGLLLFAAIDWAERLLCPWVRRGGTPGSSG